MSFVISSSRRTWGARYNIQHYSDDEEPRETFEEAENYNCVILYDDCQVKTRCSEDGASLHRRPSLPTEYKRFWNFGGNSEEKSCQDNKTISIRNKTSCYLWLLHQHIPAFHKLTVGRSWTWRLLTNILNSEFHFWNSTVRWSRTTHTLISLILLAPFLFCCWFSQLKRRCISTMRAAVCRQRLFWYEISRQLVFWQDLRCRVSSELTGVSVCRFSSNIYAPGNNLKK